MRRAVSMIAIAVLMLQCVIFPISALAEKTSRYTEQEITVGNPTPLTGKFFTHLWSNSTSDLDVMDLIHGYSLVTWDRKLSQYTINRTAVSGFYSQDLANGDRAYTFNLYKDLKYSDESEITAWDYAFAILLEIAPEIEEIGGIPREMPFLAGYDEYIEQQNLPADDEKKDWYYGLAGLRVLNKYTLKLTVRKEYLPYFFELQRFDFTPYPIKVLAPGCKVYDEGRGAYIWNEQEEITEPLFNAALIEESILNKRKGYMSHPSVVSGPYTLTSYDDNLRTAKFEINPYYKGYDEDRKGLITQITYMQADNSNAIKNLRDGKYDLLNKIVLDDTIQEGNELIKEKPKEFASQVYPRIGLTYYIPNRDSEVLETLEVRKAVAYCLDQEKAVKDYTGEYGREVYGIYGIGTWMYRVASGKIGYPIPEKQTEKIDTGALLNDWKKINLNDLKKYPVSVSEAETWLVRDHWTLNSKGKEYDKKKDKVRYKAFENEETGEVELRKLAIRIGYPKTDRNAKLITETLKDNLTEAGFEVQTIAYELKELARAYIDHNLPGVDMYYVGNNFDIIFDHTEFFDQEDKQQYDEGTMLWTYAYMDELAYDMCRTEPTDVLTYEEKWVELQEQISEYLPVFPVYGNLYVDFLTKNLKGYDIYAHVTWSENIVDCYMNEVDKTETETVTDTAEQAKDF